MFVFIVSCLLLTFLVESQSFYLPYLVADTAWQLAAGLALLCWLGGLAKKLSTPVWHDGFAAAVLWAWYGNWQPLFSPDAPMFYLFPPYFALLNAWLWWAVIGKSERFDRESREALAYLQKTLVRFDTRLLAAGVLAALWIPEHYLVFPLTMTLFIVRFSLQRCLEIVEATSV